jgi:hypothetical protein
MNALVDLGHEFEHLLGFAAFFKGQSGRNFERGKRGSGHVLCKKMNCIQDKA